ncbi:MAG: UvrD-helicase domain-containing protein, partial [Lachnospiraceae bacterium]|nr:UvrD-helicase domain-containing protein [Lachnospiraceae bacterium]
NFIRNFKVNGYDEKDFDNLSRNTSNVRTKLFLDICHACFLEYKKFLVENHAVDFEDMINESARVLNEVQDMEQKLDFKYLIVDEYQDISRQRFDLVKSFSEVTDAKIVAVGDDWQSIYAFSGSDITLFTNFEEKMGYAKLMKIVRTYRNSQEVIDIAGNFIQKNVSQIQKSLLSPKHIDEPVIIYTYDSESKNPKADRRSGVNYAIAYAVQTAIEQIIDYDKKEGRNTSTSRILLLGRFGFDGDRLARTGLFEYINRGAKIKSVKYPELDITFMTAHASKGLGYDNVIVVNGRNETYGFPSKIEDDPVLSLVVKEDTSMQYAEERRLFYVAMTRTKNRVYFIAPEKNPSEFLLEIKREYKNVYLRGKWSEEEPVFPSKKKCPICGFPLQLKYKPSYGLRLYICTNEPEVCSFMTNNMLGQKLSIMKCTNCQDGYLVIKSSKNGYFLGCTNYSRNNKGCNNTVSMQEYYTMSGYELSEDEKKVRQIIKTNSFDIKSEEGKRDNWEQKIFDNSASVEIDVNK